MIVGIGIDVVPVERFTAALARTPRTGRAAVHRPTEQVTLPDGDAARSAESLAARFAAKEALAKALGAGGGMALDRRRGAWSTTPAVPSLEVSGTVAARAASLGVTRWHVSLSHDGGIASAVVLAES